MASKLQFFPILDLPLPTRRIIPNNLPASPITSPPRSNQPRRHFSLDPIAFHCSITSRSPPVRALKGSVRYPSSETSAGGADSPPAASSSKLVLVVGGSGGVGQLIVASLLSRKIKSRLILRDPEKAVTLLGEQDQEILQVWKGDTRNPRDLEPSVFEGVTHVICCTGTTAFPSRRWDGDNTPERVDWEGVRNLVNAMPQTLKRIVLVSSIGVTKYNELPWSIMNLFGVLKYKKMGEDFVRGSGIPSTIIRAGRLTDGPYTSYDLNTLIRATAGERRAVLIGQGDKLVGEASRLVVAEACIQALDLECTEGQIFEINSVKLQFPLDLGDKRRVEDSGYENVGTIKGE